MRKTDIRRIVEAQYGLNYAQKEAVIDSLWYSIRTARHKDEAVRGLANVLSPGPLAPSEQYMREAASLFRMAEEAA